MLNDKENYMKKNQNGSTFVIVLMTVVVLGIIGGVGYMIYKNNTKQQAAAKTTAPAATATDSTQTATKYLDIPELGVKVALTNNTQDAYYVYSTEGTQKIARISSRTITSFDSQCSPDNTASLTLISYSGPNETYVDPANDKSQPISQAYPNGVTVNGRYIVAMPAQGECTVKDGYQSVVDPVNADFKTAEVVKI
jgi:uncharacterized protein (UPF0333 family)